MVYTEAYGACYKDIQNILLVGSEMKEEISLPTGKASALDQTWNQIPALPSLAAQPWILTESQSSSVADSCELKQRTENRI